MRITPVVHPITARYTRRACAAARQDGSVGDLLFAEPNISQPYLLVPDPLIVAYAHDPLAVGVYVAIARLAVASKAAVPLSARDLALWMGSRRDSDRAAIMRRIVKLEEGGWVLVERSTASKHRLLPTWGRDQNHAIRPWRFDSSDSARPSHLRGRRVPLALFDAYIGRLDPQPGSGRALISRYLTRPLLDLTDIGVYTIGLRAEVAPTPCLIHLGLCGEMGMLPPLDSQSLLTQAAAGTLTTIADGMVLPVSLTMQGQIRLGGEPLIASSLIPECDGYPGGSLCRSLDGSTGGSHDSSHEVVIVPQQDGQQASSLLSAPLIAWDVGILHESINHDSTPDRVLTGGGGMSRTGVATAANDQPACVHATRPVLSPDDVTDEYSENMPALAASVVAGHRALNPDRYIPPGEWHELLKASGEVWRSGDTDLAGACESCGDRAIVRHYTCLLSGMCGASGL
jgi:hypothetical protein